MKQFFTLFAIFAFNLSANSQILISQYVETSSGTIPKGIEIWNSSANDIDLSVMPITIFKGTNGAIPSIDHTVNAGILEAGNVLVVGTSDMTLNDLNSPCLGALYSLKAFSFNGDDALELYLDGNLMDVFGTPETDPGSSWSGSGVSTANSNIQLKTMITTGDLDGWSDPSERFETVGSGTDLTGFGQPTDGCPVNNTTTLNISTSSQDVDEATISIDVCVSIINPSATAATTVDLNFDGSSTASNGGDFSFDGSGTAISFPFTLNFTASASDDQCLTIFLENDSDIESSEAIVLNLENPSGGESANLGSNLSTTLTILDDDTILPTIDDVRINEVDCDQVSSDNSEFIELFGIPNYDLTGLAVVLFNGNGDVAYSAYDLDGHSLDANGYFIIGDAEITAFTVDILLNSDEIQNGADGVALYLADASDFPDGTAATTANLIDALVYDTNDADDMGLMMALGVTEQIDENENGNKDNESIQRGSWFVAAPSPRAENVLPVELLSFTAVAKDNQNILNWTTATEINNDRFEIERSSNGKNFKKIGKVEGRGTTYLEQDYSYADSNPLTGYNYYRLKQVDFDGAYEYSDVIRVENNRSRIMVYPTTTQNFVMVSMQEEQIANVNLMNEVGQTVKTISLLDLDNRIDVSNLPQGIYFLQVNTETENIVHKIIKQ